MADRTSSINFMRTRLWTIGHQDLPGRKIMKIQRFLIALSVLNLALLVFLLAQIEVHFLGFRFLRAAEVTNAGSVLRGRALEITDDEGGVRASIRVSPPSVLPDGTTYPETVLLRLVNSQGTPNVKLAATEDGSVMALSGDSNPTHVQISARGTTTFLKLTNKDGRQQAITP
jgi:hypothetical protein